jgi:hypothetical protein
MRYSMSKTTSVLAILVMSFGTLGVPAPSYADNNGSPASPAFPPVGVVSLPLGAPRLSSYSAYYRSTSGHGQIVDRANQCAPDMAMPAWSATSAFVGYTCDREVQ